MKRSPLKRTAPLLRTQGPATTSVPVFHPRKCSKAKGGCGETFTPKRSFEAWCSPECGEKMIMRKRAKEAEAKAKAERRADKIKREAMKKLGRLRSEAQDQFNRYIRLRDAGQPCIDCGKPLGDPRFGGSYDAGHYLSRGSAPHLAFDERNVFAQRKSCNRPGGTTRDKFRAGVITRIGLAAVEALESDQTPRRFRHDDYRAIREEYRAKAKEQERQTE